MSRPTPLVLAFATLLALLGSRAALAHSVWLEANPQGPGHVVRFGGHAGVLEDYPAEKLQQVHAYDRQGAELGVVRHDRADGVRLVPEGDAALMTLFFDNGYWSRLDSGRSENRPMDQVPGAVSGVRAVKHHKSILHWNAQASRPLGQAFELVPLADRKPRAGQPLELQVLIDGRPAAGIALAFDEEGELARSDANGRASLVVRPGSNRIWAGQRLAVSDDPRLTELSTEYSLVFHADE